MNCTLLRSTDAEFAPWHASSVLSIEEEVFTTMPMPTIQPATQALVEEEELYTSFEEAISDRLLAMQEKLVRLSDPMLNASSPARSDRRPIAHVLSRTGKLACPSLLLQGWKRVLVFSALALMFTLLGFDLMALLVLYAR